MHINKEKSSISQPRGKLGGQQSGHLTSRPREPAHRRVVSLNTNDPKRFQLWP